MPEFNNMTLVAAAEMLGYSNSQSDLDLLELEWGIQGKCRSSSKSARLADLARLAIEENVDVPTINGRLPLANAILKISIESSIDLRKRGAQTWVKLVAGLRMDGYEVVETPTLTGGEDIFGEPERVFVSELRRMHPEIAPELNFREAESEIEGLLDRHGFQIAKGHLSQAVANFTQGNWSSANAMIRDFYQELLDKIAEYFGCDSYVSDDAKRQYLATDQSGPFLYNEYNEWENDRGRPSYVLGLWARLHPHGSHPGLSDEEDCAFRFQIILITTRLFLRRFDKRVSMRNE
ncbi:hypothetical protein [Pararhizobium sp. IMCC21322]|uniref:hypothetical protein n=1 Tax=Pararhizobium sp. IMCC21322 TaxID=3067903 RepID=UPI0027412460|nr:hypothetical protein [Pararhizobium sp. IMCC21322]